MSRGSTSYSGAEARTVIVDGAVDVTEPVAGFYRCRLGSGSVWAGVYLWHGPPLDPVTGEELDRSWRWQAAWNGEPVPFDTVWPKCAADPITPAEYRRFIATQRWAREHAPDSSYAERGRRHDPLSTREPLPF